MLRLVLFFLLAVIVARAVRQLLGGVMQGMSGRASGGGVPTRGVQMTRDPVCGTFVVPERAITVSDGSRQVFFCSAACRDKFRARTA